MSHQHPHPNGTPHYSDRQTLIDTYASSSRKIEAIIANNPSRMPWTKLFLPLKKAQTLVFMHLAALGGLRGTPLSWMQTCFLELKLNHSTTNFPLKYFADNLQQFIQLCELNPPTTNQSNTRTPTDLQPFLDFLYSFDFFSARPQIYACVSPNSKSYYSTSDKHTGTSM